MENKHMEIEVIPYRGLPCSVEKFTIDGKSASEYDFGTVDTYGDCMEGDCCARFIPDMPKQEILDKYDITLEQYAEIVEVLKETLCVNGCGWCS